MRAAIMAGLDRFWSQVDRSGGADSCWPWQSGRHPNGYGQLRIEGRTQRAHRWLLGYLRGAPLLPGEVACHRCDNPPCCNPAHLYIGSQSENIADSAVRGRHREARKTHCPQGHEYSPENTYVYQRSGRGIERHCWTCLRARKAASRAAKRAAA